MHRNYILRICIVVGLRRSAFDEDLPYGISALIVGVIIALQYVGKQEQFKHQKEQYQFDDYNRPQLAAHRHAAESLDIEIQYSFQTFRIEMI